MKMESYKLYIFAERILHGVIRPETMRDEDIELLNKVDPDFEAFFDKCIKTPGADSALEMRMKDVAIQLKTKIFFMTDEDGEDED